MEAQASKNSKSTMRKLAFVCLFVICVNLLCGCGASFAEPTEDAKRFKIIESLQVGSTFNIMVDTETGVMYMYNHYTCVVMVDRYGNPLLYDGE